MAMEKPPHPGFSIVENWLDPLCLNVTDAARVLGVARHTLSRVLNGHAGISPEMAIRLEKAGWSDAEYWLRRQTAYDLLQAREQEDRIEVERYQPQPTLWEGNGVYWNTNIAVFLGAGASEAAGFPSMQDLTDQVAGGLARCAGARTRNRSRTVRTAAGVTVTPIPSHKKAPAFQGPFHFYRSMRIYRSCFLRRCVLDFLLIRVLFTYPYT